MGKTSNVDANHVRVTSADGRSSYLYEKNHSLMSSDTIVEKAIHHANGTTTALEPSGSLLNILFNGGYKHK